MFGIVNLNKPSGITSRKAINRIQYLVRGAKTGHAGTLDPLAEGVLIVTVGPATRLTNRIQNWPKSYDASFRLGQSSDTEDIDGQVVEIIDAPIPTRTELESAATRLTGQIMQQPPAYSALKVKGKRAYQLAREGKQVQLEPRPITIHELRVERYQYPDIELKVTCSSGTYVRSLGRDLARAVGTEAVMTALVRTAIGHLHVADAVCLDNLDRDTIKDHLLPPLEAVRDLPLIELTDDQIKRLAHGGDIECPQQNAPELAALTPGGELAALLTIRRAHVYGPRRNFVAAS